MQEKSLGWNDASIQNDRPNFRIFQVSKNLKFRSYYCGKVTNEPCIIPNGFTNEVVKAKIESSYCADSSGEGCSLNVSCTPTSSLMEKGTSSSTLPLSPITIPRRNCKQEHICMSHSLDYLFLY